MIEAAHSLAGYDKAFGNKSRHQAVQQHTCPLCSPEKIPGWYRLAWRCGQFRDVRGDMDMPAPFMTARFGWPQHNEARQISQRRPAFRGRLKTNVFGHRFGKSAKLVSACIQYAAALRVGARRAPIALARLATEACHSWTATSPGFRQQLMLCLW